MWLTKPHSYPIKDGLTVRWSSDRITSAPEIAVDGFGLEEISEYIEAVFL